MITPSTSWAIALAWAAATHTPEPQLRQAHCMAVNTWFEAGDLADAQLIDEVVHARMLDADTDACTVIRQPRQFSWRLERRKVSTGPQPTTRAEAQLFMNMLSLAWNELHSQRRPRLTNYHNYSVSPGWHDVCPALLAPYHAYYRPCDELPPGFVPADLRGRVGSPPRRAGAAAAGSLTPADRRHPAPQVQRRSAAPPLPQSKPKRPS